MNEKLKYLSKFGFGFHTDSPIAVPTGDRIYEYFGDIQHYLEKVMPILIQMETTIEDQKIEIEKLKLDKKNSIQKIEIVGFLGETEVPKRDIHEMKDLKFYPSMRNNTMPKKD